MIKTILLISMALASMVIASYADDAQPSSYVAAAKSSIVSIVETNSETGQWWEGTGWFIDANRIVTNDHVVNQEEESYDRTTIVNVGTGDDPSREKCFFSPPPPDPDEGNPGGRWWQPIDLAPIKGATGLPWHRSGLIDIMVLGLCDRRRDGGALHPESYCLSERGERFCHYRR
jgi:hypothetical protein